MIDIGNNLPIRLPNRRWTRGALYWSALTRTFSSLGGKKYILLTTFRRNGDAVATPIWFVMEGDRLLAFTGAQTGKAKRIRLNGRVNVAACNFRGDVRGPVIDGTARILPADQLNDVLRLIRRKYRVSSFLLKTVVELIRLVARKPQTHSVALEIQLGS